MNRNVSLGGVAWHGMAQGSILGLRMGVGLAPDLFLSYNTERRLERALAEGQHRGGQLQEQLTQQLSQALSSAVAGRLERSIRDEIKKTVPPCEFCMESKPGYLTGFLSWFHFSFLPVP